MLMAVHSACDQCELEIARHLIEMIDVVIGGPSPELVIDARALESLVAAHQRLWELRRL
jgi:hypothetical protein